MIADELIPESHGHGNERAAPIALLVGFALMRARTTYSAEGVRLRRGRTP